MLDSRGREGGREKGREERRKKREGKEFKYSYWTLVEGEQDAAQGCLKKKKKGFFTGGVRKRDPISKPTRLHSRWARANPPVRFSRRPVEPTPPASLSPGSLATAPAHAGLTAAGRSGRGPGRGAPPRGRGRGSWGRVLVGSEPEV